MRAAALSTLVFAMFAIGVPSSAAAFTGTASGAVPNSSEEAGTRDDPFAVGSTFDMPDWRVALDSVDPDAWPKIQAANQYNEPPADGHQFVMFHVTTTYLGDETGNPAFDLTWSIIGSAGDTFGSGLDDYCGLLPDGLSDQGELFPGATAAGNVCVSVPADQVDGATIELDAFLTSTQAFLATKAGQGTPAPSPEGTLPPAATLDPSAVRGSRANPFAVGDDITLTDWSLKVDSVDVDAWPEIQQANDFNDPPADGRQFVMFHVAVTNTGADAGNPSLDPSWRVVGSEGNTFGASLNDYCGVIPDALSDQGDDGQVSPGESVAGNICVSVPSDQLGGATIRIEPAFGDEPVFVAIG